MKSAFKILFYLKKNAVRKDGKLNQLKSPYRV